MQTDLHSQTLILGCSMYGPDRCLCFTVSVYRKKLSEGCIILPEGIRKVSVYVRVYMG